ncbi:spore germination protein (amino acid permease) [Clostridium acetobutylicum]|uniref:Spore germination protein n=2 Tax=Clostridium acetobutylicum TaxID=1488 RepID=Q97LB9_CLOAB|nr:MULTISPECIES: endospore germination permease [Clostridium]AAK78620.1 Putative spore germination protein [Clostridium acetobutylicum ATCC 824]ADZ19694.1 Putative spore germination protein [Clostridium acetobutylicum EA 2018]AEI31352.1 putative spore germination protein [Clostridium acetobutylicum DSM 1731]AWV80343.1 spore gernimation protein [Clostridium acetobutylicum]MBC2392531.1 endospore germination permease [Clostridium acetobutylicum]
MRYLSKNYLIFIALGTSIVTIKTYPTLLIQYGERDTWLALIFSSLLLLAFLLIIIKAFSTKSDAKLKTVYFKAFGKYLGAFLLWAFAFTLILTLIECSASESSMLGVNILDKTPPWYFILFFIVPATYVILHGENSMLILTIVGIFFIFISGCNLSVLLFAYRKIEYILPIMKHGVNKNFITCVFKGLAMFSGFGIIIPFIYKVKSREEIKKPILIAWILIAQIQVFATSGLLMTIAAPRVVAAYYPRLLQTQLVNYFNFIESGELYVLFQVIGGWFVKYILTFYAFLIILKQLNVKRKYVFYVITICVAIISFAINRSVLNLFVLINYYTYIAFANFIIIPFVASIIFILKEKKSSKGKKQEEVETV